MKNLDAILSFAVWLAPALAAAQNTDAGSKLEWSAAGIVGDSLTDVMVDESCSLPVWSAPPPLVRSRYCGADLAGADSLHLPTLNMQGQVPLMAYPYGMWWGMDTWNLHRGLNVNLGLSVFASFGKNAPGGAGFVQDISLMYAMPLSGKLSLALGGWVSNAYWAHDRFTDAGLNAVLGYRFNDRWEAYVYARKSIMNKPVPYRFRSMHELGDRIGAAVRYNISPCCSIQVSVSAGQCPAPSGDDFTMNHSLR